MNVVRNDVLRSDFFRKIVQRTEDIPCMGCTAFRISLKSEALGYQSLSNVFVGSERQQCFHSAI